MILPIFLTKLTEFQKINSPMLPSLPGRVRGFVAEWAELHQQELLSMWESKNFHKIDSLV
jgi:hypothetical protein